MPYPEEASTAEMINYTIQALWSYKYMKTLLFPGLATSIPSTKDVKSARQIL